jgi:hypothetical protein
MIFIERCSEGPKIAVVTCGRAWIDMDMETQGNQME